MVDGDTMLLKITDAGLRAIGSDPNDTTAADDATQHHRPEPGEAAPPPPAGGGEPVPGGEDASAPDAAQAAPEAQDEGEPEEEEDRPRHERLGVDEALIYGPAEEWTQPADDAALLEQALAEGTPRGLKAAAQAVLAAWEDEANRATDIIAALDGPMARLRAALAGKPPRRAREPGAPRKPRAGTKQEQVVAMLRRPEGATVAQIAEATGWAPHTVRGFFAGLKKRQGIAVEVLERVRQVGPNKEGARGSYTVYRIAG
jgi:hypothetical protein